LHLRHPLQALSAVRSITGGELLSYDTISPLLTVAHPRTPVTRFRGGVQGQWWVPNLAARKSMMEEAGFHVVRAGGVVFVRRPGIRLRPRPFLRHPFLVMMLRFAGVPQSWILARPQAEPPR